MSFKNCSDLLLQIHLAGFSFFLSSCSFLLRGEEKKPFLFFVPFFLSILSQSAEYKFNNQLSLSKRGGDGSSTPSMKFIANTGVKINLFFYSSCSLCLKLEVDEGVDYVLSPLGFSNFFFFFFFFFPPEKM